MKTDRQPERETDESQLIGFSSWFYGPTDRPPPLVAELVGGMTSHKLRRIDHRRNTIPNTINDNTGQTMIIVDDIAP